MIFRLRFMRFAGEGRRTDVLTTPKKLAKPVAEVTPVKLEVFREPIAWHTTVDLEESPPFDEEAPKAAGEGISGDLMDPNRFRATPRLLSCWRQWLQRENLREWLFWLSPRRPWMQSALPVPCRLTRSLRHHLSRAASPEGPSAWPRPLLSHRPRMRSELPAVCHQQQLRRPPRHLLPAAAAAPEGP
jgi:hypothetical protein